MFCLSDIFRAPCASLAETEIEYEHEVSNEVEHEDPSYDPNDFSSGKMTEPR